MPSSPEKHTPEIEDESVSNEPDITADLGEESVGHVPKETERVDSPDKDLATESAEEEVTPTEEPEEPAEPVEETEEEVEEHPDLSKAKETLESEIEELQEKARQAREKWEHWRDASRDARAAHFQGREVQPPPEEPGIPPAQPPGRRSESARGHLSRSERWPG